MSDYRRPVDTVALAHNFRVFAAADCAHEPLYAALCDAVAACPDVLAMLIEAPYAQRRPVLLFAAIHDLLLAGGDHPLARFYRSVTPAPGRRRDLAAAGPLLVDFCLARRDALAALLQTRGTQTNEVGRCAGLRLALATLSTDGPIALVDVGCSAGLNLLVDRYRVVQHRPDGTRRTSGPDSPVVVEATISTGEPGDAASIPPIARRIGIDVAPLDAKNPRDARWLRACVWPSDDDRAARLEAALALATQASLDLRTGTATACLAEVVASIPDDVRPVVFHSWVVSYFDGAAKRDFARAVHDLVVARDAVWISAEGPGVVPGLEAPPLADDADAAHREATLWHVTTREGGSPVTRVVARTHPHCRWIDWLA